MPQLFLLATNFDESKKKASLEAARKEAEAAKERAADSFISKGETGEASLPPFFRRAIKGTFENRWRRRRRRRSGRRRKGPEKNLHILFKRPRWKRNLAALVFAPSIHR